MPDDWVRTPAQQSAIDLQALIDAHRRSDVVVRTYPGDAAEAFIDYRADAARMVPAGWYPVAQQLCPPSVEPAEVAIMGTLAVTGRSVGSLMVVWQCQGPGSPTPPGHAPEAG